MKQYLIVAVSFILFCSFDFENGEPAGKNIYEINCIKCHGPEGDRKKWGAKDLRKSSLADYELTKVISNGKRGMPAWKYSLNEKQITAVIDYIKTFRK